MNLRQLLLRFSPVTLAGLLVLSIALTLYLYTLDNGLRLDELKGGDLITHQYAQVQARPSNAPGYPLYTMGGWLWFRLGRWLLSPLFNPTEVLSLYSTLWGLASLAILYILILEATDRNWPIAALGTLFTSFTYFFWYYSSSTEQYTSAVFQTLVMVLWAFRWERTRQDKYLYWLALMAGLCLANLVTVLFILPPLLALVVSGERSIVRRPKVILKCVALALIPLVSYAYVYLRGASHPEWWGAGEWRTGWDWFVSFVSTQQGRDELTWTLGPLTAEFPGLILWDMSVVGLVLGLIGWWWLGRRRAGFLFGSLLIYLVFSYIDRYGNWYQVFMPMYPLLAMGVAVTAHRLWQWSSRHSWRRGLRAAILVSMGLLVASRLIDPDPRAFQRNRPDDDGLQPGRAILADQPPQNATIIGDTDQFLSLAYLTEIWWVRPDIRAARLSEVENIVRENRGPVYITAQVAPLVIQQIGPRPLAGYGAILIELRSEPLQDTPATAQRLGSVVGQGLRLEAYQFEEREIGPLTPWDRAQLREVHRRFRLTLFWAAASEMQADWSVSVRPTQRGHYLPMGGGIVQMDVQHPVLGLYPMSRWSPGEVVRDDYVIPLSPAHEYDGAQIVVYRQVGDAFDNLGAVDIPLRASVSALPQHSR